MKVYIASKFENKAGFDAARKHLEAYGHTVTHDWTVESYEPGDEARMTEIAVADYNGVVTCDAILFLAYPKMAGAFTELGIALALHKHVVVVGAYDEGNPANIFYSMPKVAHFESIEDAVTTIDIIDQSHPIFNDSTYV